MDLQEEEREVILAIYEGDPAFNQLSPVTFQYKYGVDGDTKSFLLELTWSENYPNEKPKINLDTFYNKHVTDAAKKRICDIFLEEAEHLVGGAMTYSLIEFIKEKYEAILEDGFAQSASDLGNPDTVDEAQEDKENEITPLTKMAKKIHLTKAQKRKQWDRVDSKGERPRGWDWVDIVHHLTQTGPKQPPTDN